MSNTMLGGILIAVFILGSPLSHAAQTAENIHFNVINTFNVGGEGRWDLLTFDAKQHRLFVSRATHVQVIDANSGKIVGDIPDTEGVHGIALAEEFNVGFTSNGKSNSVTVFDLNTLKIIETIKTSGLNPDVIIFEPKSKHVFAFNGHSNNATVIDAATHKEIASINLPGKPELAVSDEAGKVYVNIEDKSKIIVIDSATNNVINTYALGSGTEPTGLAIDQKHHRLFSVCDNHKMEILDAQSGEIISEQIIGAGPDSAAFDPSLGVAFSSNGEGTLTVVKENEDDHFSVAQNVITQKGARTMAYDADKHIAYLVTASFGETPPATKDQPKPRPSIMPNSFVVLVIGLTH